MKPKVRGRASEDIASAVLEEMGFKVLEKRKRVEIEGVEVAEVDIVAEKEGELYAVEVKSGTADVSTIRYAYANAEMLGMKPLVVARGFSNEAAKVVAEKLGVKVIELSDLFLADGEEIYIVVKEALRDVLHEILERILICDDVKEDDLKVLSAVVSSKDFKEVGRILGISEKEVVEKIVDLKRRGVIGGRGGFKEIKLEASLVLLCKSLRR